MLLSCPVAICGRIISLSVQKQQRVQKLQCITILLDYQNALTLIFVGYRPPVLCLNPVHRYSIPTSEQLRLVRSDEGCFQPVEQLIKIDSVEIHSSFQRLPLLIHICRFGLRNKALEWHVSALLLSSRRIGCHWHRNG